MKWRRLIDVAYCALAGVVFSFALQSLDAPFSFDDAACAVILAPISVSLGWGCAGIFFWPIFAALAYAHFKRPRIAVLVAISLVTAGAFLRSVEGLHIAMSA